MKCRYAYLLASTEAVVDTALLVVLLLVDADVKFRPATSTNRIMHATVCAGTTVQHSQLAQETVVISTAAVQNSLLKAPLVVPASGGGGSKLIFLHDSAHEGSHQWSSMRFAIINIDGIDAQSYVNAGTQCNCRSFASPFVYR